MKNYPKTHLQSLVWLFAVLVGTSLANAKFEGEPYSINKATIDNGGGVSSGGEYILTGTIGQPDASPQSSVGGEITLTGGFWANGGGVIGNDVIFSGGFENQ